MKNWRTTIEWPSYLNDLGAHSDIEYQYESSIGETVIRFNARVALAALLLEEFVFVSGDTLHVSCNDLFAWGSADYEDLSLKDVESLYRMYDKDPLNGVNIWCIIQRREMPQSPVENIIRNAGVWDLDSLKTEHSLRPNYYDNITTILGNIKRELYELWIKANPQVNRPKDWYEAWQEYVQNNPDWHTDEVKALEAQAIAKFRSENGYEDAS